MDITCCKTLARFYELANKDAMVTVISDATWLYVQQKDGDILLVWRLDILHFEDRPRAESDVIKKLREMGVGIMSEAFYALPKNMTYINADPDEIWPY